ncbi:alpha/beta hydrolase family protein [Tsuneonella sp. HG249]
MYGTDRFLAPSVPASIVRYAKHPRGFAELRLPQGAGPFPLAVIFHGGCWKTGIATQTYMAPLATRWQQLGIATLNVDYREVGDGGGWPGSFEDWAGVEKAIDDVKDDPRLDLSRLTLVGHSAGALPAQWLATNQNRDGPLGRRWRTLEADAIVFDGPADLSRDQAPFDALCQFSAVAPFMGGSAADVPKRYAAVSPIGHPAQLRRLHFVQAKLPAPDAAALAALRDAGVEVEVTLKADATHFDVITPGAAAYDSIEPKLLELLRK